MCFSYVTWVIIVANELHDRQEFFLKFSLNCLCFSRLNLLITSNRHENWIDIEENDALYPKTNTAYFSKHHNVGQSCQGRYWRNWNFIGNFFSNQKKNFFLNFKFESQSHKNCSVSLWHTTKNHYITAFDRVHNAFLKLLIRSLT